MCGEHPVDAGAAFGATMLPGLDLSFKPAAAIDAAVETLAPHDADFDFDHIQPTRMA
jgi:hypothetical protein